MRIDRAIVGMGAEEYRAHIEALRNANEIRRCLVNLDAAGMRRIWAKMSPHLPQPESDYAALHTMHIARTKMENLSPQAKQYSEHWLREHLPVAKIVSAVGIAVKPRSADSRERAFAVTAAMYGAVEDCIKAGIDLDIEAAEVRRRMQAAYDREHRNF